MKGMQLWRMVSTHKRPVMCKTFHAIMLSWSAPQKIEVMFWFRRIVIIGVTLHYFIEVFDHFINCPMGLIMRISPEPFLVHRISRFHFFIFYEIIQCISYDSTTEQYIVGTIRPRLTKSLLDEQGKLRSNSPCHESWFIEKHVNRSKHV